MLKYLPETMPQIFKLFKIYLSIPVSSATGERSFSCLPRLKSYLRTTTGQQRLSDLAVANIESEKLKGIDVDIIINEFASVKKRRLKFH